MLNPESLKLSNVSCDKETGKMSVRKLVQTSLLEAQVKEKDQMIQALLNNLKKHMDMVKV